MPDEPLTSGLAVVTQSPVIAVDGPSGSGKSTVARRVAAQLGWRYVDTGATYRAVTLAVLREGVDPTDAAAVLRVLGRVRVELGTDPLAPTVRLDGEEVSAEVRSPAVTAAVSAVSAHSAVRRRLVDLQRSLAGTHGAVVEGRDIGTVVVPSAVLKVFLDAAPDVRAERRAAEVHSGVAVGAAADRIAVVAADLARRDKLDSGRSAGPLAAAPDAVHVDATALDADGVTEQVLAHAARVGVRPGRQQS